MDKAYTPQKDSKSSNRNTAAQSYLRKTPDSVGRSAPASQLALLKDYQSLKIQVRQLEAKNRTLSSQVQQLLYEKSYNQSKIAQKMTFQEETLAQFHKQKNYQMELLQIKHQEELSRQRRQFQQRIDEFLRDIKHKDYQLKQKDDHIRYLESRSEELKKDCQNIDLQLIKSRQQNAVTNQNLTHVQFRNKKLEMLVDELEAQKSEMESQIRVLLDIQAEKSRDINSLEIRLRNSEQNQRRLTQKLSILSENFNELEQHISIMKSKLLSADQENHSLAKQLDHANFQIKEKQRHIIDQNDRQGQLRIEIEDHQKRQSRRQREVNELMDENQRLYKQLNINRHRLHEMGIAYGFDV